MVTSRRVARSHRGNTPNLRGDEFTERKNRCLKNFLGKKIMLTRSATLPSSNGSMITSFQLFKLKIIGTNQPRGYVWAKIIST